MKIKEILNIVKKDIIEFISPSIVQIMLSNGRGISAVPCVNVGDRVHKGQRIAKAENGMLCVDVHSSIDGEVKEIKFNSSLNKNETDAICITSNDSESVMQFKELPKIKIKTISSLRNRLSQAGVVGCGGAGFPSYAKIKEGIKYKYLIVNACVSDYYTCADLGVVYHEHEEVIKGIEVLNEILNFEKVYIVVNSLAKKILKDIIIKYSNLNIEFVFMPNKLGQGDEKKLCKKILNYEEVKTFPSYDGILVFNAQTVQNIFRAVSLGLPMISRVVTLYGKSLNENVNCRIAIGANVNEVIKGTVGEICEYEYFEEREEFAKNRFWELNDLRKEFKENKDDEFVTNFALKRKEINGVLFDFIKFEHLNKRHLRERIQINGNHYGYNTNQYYYPIQKNHYSVGILNKKESYKIVK